MNSMRTGFDLSATLTDMQRALLNTLVAAYMQDSTKRSFLFMEHNRGQDIRPSEIILMGLRYNAVAEDGMGTQLKDAYEEILTKGELSPETVQSNSVVQEAVRDHFEAMYADVLRSSRDQTQARQSTASVMKHLFGAPDGDSKYSSDDEVEDNSEFGSELETDEDGTTNTVSSSEPCTCSNCQSLIECSASFQEYCENPEPWQAFLINVLRKTESGVAQSVNSHPE